MITNNIIRFSIITPAYRGEKYLPKLYSNLLHIHAQHYNNFEWIIVDDFSNDAQATAQVISNIIAEAPFVIKTIFLEKNYYGARSVDVASQIAIGEYVIILDQDDALENDALNYFGQCIINFGSAREIAGICGRCINARGEFIGKPIKNAPRISTEFDIRHINRIRGEMLQCTRTEIVRENFKIMQPGNTNGYAWAKIASTHKFVYTNKVVRHYDTSNPNSVTNIAKVRFICTVASQYTQYIQSVFKYIHKDPAQIIRIALHAVRFRLYAEFICGCTITTPSLKIRIFFSLLKPFAMLLVLRDKYKNNIYCD
jgi:glycosyltransferase involved in cell wall biosynthesis